MAPGSLSIPNTFQTQVGLVPAAELDDNYTTIRDYVNAREVSSGTLAARPVNPTAGLWYFANDLDGGTLFFGNGTSWVPAASISGSGTLLAPLTLIDATGGGITKPFMSFQETGSETWRVFYQRPAFFGNSATLSFSPITAQRGALQFSLISADGGQRVAIWDSSTVLPNVPHTSIPPTLAVFGDILAGDYVCLASNPQTLFIRANTDLPVSAVTQFFSSQHGPGVEPDSGAAIVYAPMKNGGGAVSDGFVQYIAYGGGTGASANEHQFRHRSGSNTVQTVWHIGGGADAPIYPDADNTYDIGTPGTANRVRAIYVSSGVIMGGTVVKSRAILAFNNIDAAPIATGVNYVGQWATSTAEEMGVAQILTCSGTLRSLYVRMGTAPGANQDVKVTARINGASTTLTTTVSGTAISGEDLVNTQFVPAGSRLTMQYTLSSGAADSNGVAIAVQLDSPS
jgi:hypothetical protein